MLFTGEDLSRVHPVTQMTRVDSGEWREFVKNWVAGRDRILPDEYDALSQWDDDDWASEFQEMADLSRRLLDRLECGETYTPNDLDTLSDLVQRRMLKPRFLYNLDAEGFVDPESVRWFACVYPGRYEVIDKPGISTSWMGELINSMSWDLAAGATMLISQRTIDPKDLPVFPLELRVFPPEAWVREELIRTLFTFINKKVRKVKKCEECLLPYIILRDRGDNRFCSKRCSDRASVRKRRALKKVESGVNLSVTLL